MGEAISAEIQELLRGDLVKARFFAEFWQTHATELMAKYGGSWVAFRGTTVVAHGRNGQALGRRLRDLGGPTDVQVRYVPKPTDRFVLGA